MNLEGMNVAFLRFRSKFFTANFQSVSAHKFDCAGWTEHSTMDCMFAVPSTVSAGSYDVKCDLPSLWWQPALRFRCTQVGLKHFGFSWGTCCDSTSFSTKSLPTGLIPVSCLHMSSKLEQSIAWAGGWGEGGCHDGFINLILCKSVNEIKKTLAIAWNRKKTGLCQFSWDVWVP